MAGTIQSGVNQLLGLAGAAAALSPELRIVAEERAKVRGLERSAAKSEEATDIISAKMEEAAAEKNTDAYKELSKDINETFESREATLKELYALDPTKKRYNIYESTKAAKKSNIATQEKVMQELSLRAGNKVKQKNAFLDLIDYLSEVERGETDVEK
jgi:hypothetical protein